MQGVPSLGPENTGEPRPSDATAVAAFRPPQPRRARGGLRLRTLGLLLASVALAAAGQFTFSSRGDYLVDGLVLYGAAMLLFAALLKSMESPAAGTSRRAGSPWQLVLAHWRRLSLTGLGLLLCAWAARAAVVQPRTGDFAPAFVAWLVGCALVVGAQLPATAPATWRALPGSVRAWLEAHRLEVLALVLWVALAAALRLWQLGEAPYPFSGDEASMGLEARRVLSGELRNPFATGWLSHPTLWFFWQAPFLAALGPDILGVRLPSALIGIGTVVAVYLLAREMFGVTVAQVSTAFLATYSYHVNFSRQGLNNIADPWLAAWTFYFLYRGLKRRELLSLALGGAALGLIQYGYLGARVVPIIVAAYLLYLLLSDRATISGQIGGLAVFAAAAFAVALPIVAWYFVHPSDLTARLAQVGLFQSGWLEAETARTGRSALQIVLDQMQRSFLAFNLYPDTSPFYRAPGPLLGFWASLCFAFGIAYAVFRWRDRRLALLLLWLALTLITGGVLTLTPPYAARLVATIPVVCILVALGLQKIVTLGVAAAGLPKPAATSALAVAAGLIMVLDVAFYVNTYIPGRYFSDGNTEIANLAGKYLSRLDNDYQVYFLGPPRMFVGHPPFIYLSGGENTKAADVGVDIERPLAPRQRPPQVQADSRLVFIVLPERAKELETLQQFFPGGELRHFGGRFGENLYIIYRLD